jgi:uncharacterized membrane protein YccC
MKGAFLRTAIVVLMVCLAALLLFSPAVGWIMLLSVTAATLGRNTVLAGRKAEV